MPEIRLNSPRYRVILGDPEDPNSWQELSVQAITPDLTAAESLFIRHKWGKPTDSPMKLVSVSAFFALRRSGQIEGSWEAFEAGLIEVGEAQIEAIRPTGASLEAD